MNTGFKRNSTGRLRKPLLPVTEIARKKKQPAENDDGDEDEEENTDEDDDDDDDESMETQEESGSSTCSEHLPASESLRIFLPSPCGACLPVSLG